MDAVAALQQLGGVASHDDLTNLSSRHRLRTAVVSGRVERFGHGWYRLPDQAGSAAARLRGVRSHVDAALHWGWPVKAPSRRPQISVPRGRKLPKERRRGVDVHWSPLAPEELAQGVTSPLRTVLDCARDLPFDAALAVADSALRSGLVTSAALERAAAVTRGPGTPRVRRVAEHASARARNPFESVLRALAIQTGLDVICERPTVAGGKTLHPDLTDVRRRLLIEGDSYSWHGGKPAFERDCWRYTVLTTAGWRILRFTWAQVMNKQEWVLAVLSEWAAQPQGLSMSPVAA